ncbi:MAG: biotin/lipoyl-binding protein, partial [Rhodocyclaceae bacterium]|nr:biotin/lipoyl-binding protein [Rhodocyclaceae bacterium]
VCRPAAARDLGRALKEEDRLPNHFHTHDTSGASVASVLAAVEAGVDAVDGAMDAMSGLTSQPSLGAIVAALEHTERDTGLTHGRIAPFSRYWEGVRRYYAPFEADIRAGTSDVYRHEMPGGQYTNLREQARAMGLEHRWNEVAQAYADANQLFGDIVKVTPSSKVVGDLALTMVANDWSAQDIADPEKEIAFPESVVAMMRGDLGYPADGFPPALQKRILKGQTPIKGRVGAHLPAVDLEGERKKAEKVVGHHIDDAALASWLMYPKVYADYAEHHRKYGDVSVLPTPVFFYGLGNKNEMSVEIDRGKTLVVRLLGETDAPEEGEAKLFFELNGQSRPMRIARAGAKPAKRAHPKAEEGNPAHIAAPMPGMVATVAVQVGQKVRKGSPLLSIEAMKMETVLNAERDATITKIHVAPGERIEAKDLLLELS